MTVCQMMTGGGGWPLSVFMAPNKEPFFAGTYIPKERRGVHVGFRELLTRIQALWHETRETLFANAKQITEALTKMEDERGNAVFNPNVIEEAYQALHAAYDSIYGGFRKAPKFPMPTTLLFLLRYYTVKGDPDAELMVEHTLSSMRLGGIHDHIGFGFHRYATDGMWRVPHFEKMLYDQALIARVALECYGCTDEETYARIADEVFEYVLRDMQNDEGAFYCAEDADSEGVEGAFYTWGEDELRTLLTEKEFALWKTLFGVLPKGNYYDESMGEKTGKNILYHVISVDDYAARNEKEEREVREVYERARAKLFTARTKRIRPMCDDKILTDWNGLMIESLAYAARIRSNTAYRTAAERALSWVRIHLHGQGTLLHRYRGGIAGIAAHATDYAYLLSGVLELFTTTQERELLAYAKELADEMLSSCGSDEGGLYTTSAQDEDVLLRQINFHDGALPSANAVAVSSLTRLARLTGEPAYEDVAHRILARAGDDVAKHPEGYTHLLTGAILLFETAYEVVVVGERDADDTREIMDVLLHAYLPNAVIRLVTPEEDAPAYIKAMTLRDGKTTVFICRNYSCEEPLHNVASVKEALRIS